MAKTVLILFATAIVSVICEPPVGQEYLPPSQQRSGGGYSRSGSTRSLSTSYSAPSSRFNAGSAGLSTRYGAPSSRFGNGHSTSFSGASSRFNSGSAGPSTSYGAPSSRFGNGAAGPSTQYGAPSASVTSARFSAPSSQYSAPSFASGRFNEPSSEYGAPSMASSRFGGSPSTQYGAPSITSSRFSGRSSGLSSQYGAPSPVYGAPFGRSAAQEDPLAEPANYEFGYDVQDPESGSEFGQEETRQDESARGSYRVLLPDGRLQIVEYEADEEGYKPIISYEDTNNGPYPASRGAQGPY